MFQPIHAIALRTVKYNDRTSILTAWTAEMGRISVLMPAGSGPESRRRRALTMPMSLFEGVVDVRPGREIMPVRDMRPVTAGADVSSDPMRATVAMFLAEVMTAVTREGGGDEGLWRLLVESVSALAGARGTMLANFHLVFLSRLATVLGIEPDVSTWVRGRGLDLLDGVFRTTRPFHDHWTDAAGARLATTLLRMTDYSHGGLLRMDRATRNAALDTILRYYTLHHTPLDNLNSLSVVRAVLA